MLFFKLFSNFYIVWAIKGQSQIIFDVHHSITWRAPSVLKLES